MHLEIFEYPLQFLEHMLYFTKLRFSHKGKQIETVSETFDMYDKLLKISIDMHKNNCSNIHEDMICIGMYCDELYRYDEDVVYRYFRCAYIKWNQYEARKVSDKVLDDNVCKDVHKLINSYL
jgi:hypothetical protein